MLFKTKILLLSLLALLLVFSVAAEAASAAGPYFHAREAGGKGGGEDLNEAAPMEVQGKGGEQALKGTIGGVSVALKSPGVKVSGSIWNNTEGQTKLEGQVKLELKYMPITIVEPSLSKCQAEISSQSSAHNLVFANGSLAWTWNGEEKQREEQPVLNQKPDIILVPPGTQLQEGTSELPKGTFAEVKFTGSGCGILAGTFPIKGSMTGSLKPEKLEEWGSALALSLSEGKAKQHFWNGSKNIGVETGLLFGGNPASLTGEMKLNTEQGDEISVFEALAAVIRLERPIGVEFGMIGVNKEASHTFTYKNLGPVAWAPKESTTVVMEEGGWVLERTDLCRGGTTGVNNTCTVTLTVKPTAAGKKIKVRYRTGLAPWMKVTAES